MYEYRCSSEQSEKGTRNCIFSMSLPFVFYSTILILILFYLNLFSLFFASLKKKTTFNFFLFNLFILIRFLSLFIRYYLALVY